ncbi:PEP-CTERM sorting domain-containing protein [Adhaeretor mobilis]|uniref:PEP-CTERM protein-sorting domain-containing protein n=1 Tax=Adhaeretor mobilis TaxID=1930276 RepID=A0A517MTP0_9BACT|nr:PEP-CTERM sorting domain-containing protein [Adhaeretor mobilis]QDS98249.1 hypothetical protein HG15A2_15220 [Adhaeretor mobilis]
MSMRIIRSSVLCTLFVALAAGTASAQLYTEDFDDGNASTRWTAHAGVGAAGAATPIDTNFDAAPFTGVDGVTDDTSGFAFDYSTVGIPLAPNSSSATTVGLKLQFNLFTGLFGGFSVSPNSLNLTGDYSMTFDAWSNTINSGGTNLSTFGLLTAGTSSNAVLNTDGVFFSYTSDGGSSADYRAYSVDQSDSYNLADNVSDPPVPAEPNATHYAVDVNGDPTRNAPGELYGQAVGTANEAPQAMKDALALAWPLAEALPGPLQSGAAGFAWQEHEIRKTGDLVEWYVNGFKLIDVDTAPFKEDLGGGNISFGHQDVNNGSSGVDEAVDFLFTLIDNIEVNAITAGADNADFDGSGVVDGDDFLTWQANDGAVDALLADGDANSDTFVNGDDLTIWQDQYGPVPASIGAVPEPTTLVISLIGLTALAGIRRSRLI